MDTVRFWAIIGASRSGFDPQRLDGNMDAQLQQLESLLDALPAEEIAQFESEFEQRMADAYRWDLWGAAYVIQGGCSDDGFIDFRSWLISMGREVYEAALRDPETLVDVADASGVEETSFEDFQYAARQIYESKTGHELPDTGVSHDNEPRGEPWSEDRDDLAQLLPKLWQRYGDV